MTERGQYTFADLNEKPALVEQIVSLEHRLRDETGQPVTLIAYSPVESIADKAPCRADLDD
ncbi:hypothetical protein [Paenibacillus sp. GYB003]|uniref:hypothetical protein n=1 Tax=Paenibacillus sp. GYB003 TaxID=2994392 RepID=UPI002F969668